VLMGAVVPYLQQRVLPLRCQYRVRHHPSRHR